MYHYCFECSLTTRECDNTKFVVEGSEILREDCVAIHNALNHSPDIVICSSSIELESKDQ